MRIAAPYNVVVYHRRESPLRFILGRAGSGKTTTVLQECLAVARDAPWGPPLVLLAPEQATYQLERALLEGGATAVARIQVLSFRRLAYRVLEETGGLSTPRVDTSGRRMILRFVAPRLAAELRVFGGSVCDTGWIAALAEEIAELEAYHHTPGELLRTAESLADSTGDRLHDMALCWRAYRQHLGTTLGDPGSDLSLAAEVVHRTSLRRATYWIDGFAGFTPRELHLLGALLRAGAELNVALCLDALSFAPDGTGAWPAPDPDQPFYPTQKTLHQLLDLRERCAAPWNGTLSLDRTGMAPWRFRSHDDRARIESALAGIDPGPPCAATNVKLLIADSTRTEALCIAQEIVRLCREDALRYRQIAVVTHDLDTYAEQLHAAFGTYGIPHFIDVRKPAVRHPLVRVLPAALRIIREGWTADAVQRYLETDLAGIPRQQADAIALLPQRNGAFWYEPEHSPCPLVTAPVRQLELALTEGATGHDAALALVTFLQTIGAEETMTEWVNEAEPEEASWHRQIWTAVLGVLDQIRLTLGQQPLDLAELSAVLASGLEDISVGLLPPCLDQVLCGSIDRSRHPELRCVFIPGMVEGGFPRSPREGTLLRDDDRIRLAAAGVEVAPTRAEDLLRARYLDYIALTRSSERLYLSYPAGAEPAEALRRVMDLFSELPSWGRSDGPSASRGTAFLAAEVALRSTDGNPGGIAWETARRWLADRDVSLAPPTALATPLPRHLIRQAYAGRRFSSTQLESMAACPFQHFARFGLRLHEHTDAGLSPAEAGRLVHDVLAQFIDTAQDNHLNWAEHSREQIETLVEEALRRAVDRLSQDTPTSRHAVRSLRHDVHRAAQAVAHHLGAGAYRPLGAEISFGNQGDDWPPLRLGGLSIGGRIDRVDVAIDPDTGRTALRIIDYKTGRASFRLQGLLQGVDLQPAVYLAAALAARPDSEIGGIFLLPTAHRWDTVDGPPDDTPDAPPRLEGIAPAEPAALRLHERALDGSITGVRLRNDGKPRADAPVLSARGFQGLISVLTDVVQDLGQRIKEGDIRPRPVRRGTTLACLGCPYPAVCRFDPTAGDSFRPLPDTSAAAARAQMEANKHHG